MEQHKALTGLKVTSAEEGKVTAVFATLNTKDSDGDVTLAGAFKSEPVQISAYNHQSWKGALPVGKGVIKEVDDEAIFEGEFFLDTTAGKDTFEVVKQMGDLQEWSYGYDTLDSERGTKNGESVNFLKDLKVHEVSPVILGAGVGTRTLATKGRQKQMQSDLYRRLAEAGAEQFGDSDTYVYVEDFEIDALWVVYCIEGGGEYRYVQVAFTRADDGTVTLADGDEVEVERTTTYAPKSAKNLQLKRHAGAVLTAVDVLSDRVADVVAKRAEKGKELGSESQDLLHQLDERMGALKAALAGESKPNNDDTTTDTKGELEQVYLRHLRHSLPKEG